MKLGGLAALAATAVVVTAVPERRATTPPRPSRATLHDIAALAKTVRAGEVVMYASQTCANCAEAKAWLGAHGFAFTECDVDARPHCAAEYRAHGATGTPYLVIRRGGREHRMKDGFDSDEFLAAL